ncbi:hypothetical protein ACVXHB_27800 [Escherichia coli]
MKHSLIFASVIGIITLLQAYVFTGMLVSKSIKPDDSLISSGFIYIILSY